MEYRAKELPRIISIDKLVSFHYFEYVKDFKGIDEKHDFWEFVYVDSGEIYVKADEKSIQLKNKQSFLHRPNQIHNIYSNNSFASTFVFSFYSNSKELYYLANHRYDIHTRTKDAIKYLWSLGCTYIKEPYNDFLQTEINWREETNEYSKQLLKTQLELIFLLLLSEQGVESELATAKQLKSEKPPCTNIEKILTVLEENIYKTITLEEIAAQASFSPSYVEKLFKKETKLSVKNYYHQLKIARAKELISYGNFTLTEISEKLDYGTIHNFSRVFKKYTGMSPSTYQNTIIAKGLL